MKNSNPNTKQKLLKAVAERANKDVAYREKLARDLGETGGRRKKIMGMVAERAEKDVAYRQKLARETS
jgi:hypothetical protein